MDDIQLLQAIANEEIGDISLYRSESRLFAEKIVGGDRISETFNKFALEEERHLEGLSAISEKPLQLRKRSIPPSSSLRKTLRMHMIREADSVKLYETLLASREKDSDKEVIKRIISQENSHLKTIKRYLLLIG